MYQRLKPSEFFEKVQTEEQARMWFWRAKFEGRDFVCPHCQHEHFYGLRTRPEVRTCKKCSAQIRLRPNTILERSKVPLLIWMRALFFIAQDKRGVSALQMMRQLGLSSFDTAWHLLQKIRHALLHRDNRYLLKGVVEFDGASFDSEARRRTRENRVYPPNSHVLLAIETKEWVDEKGRLKKKAGFAKVVVNRQTSIFSQKFAESALRPGTEIHADGAHAFDQLPGVRQEVMHGFPAHLEAWLPWVFRFVTNAKAWIAGTHHGVSAKYLPGYMAEYTYRFNRRHDPDGMLDRAITACALSPALTRDKLTLRAATG